MARYQTLKWKFYVIAYYITFFIRRLILRHLTLFDWKFLQIGTLRAKDLRKNLSKLQSGRLNPVPLTLLVIRVVLLLWSYGLWIVQRFLSWTVFEFVARIRTTKSTNVRTMCLGLTNTCQVLKENQEESLKKAQVAPPQTIEAWTAFCSVNSCCNSRLIFVSSGVWFGGHF